MIRVILAMVAIGLIVAPAFALDEHVICDKRCRLKVCNYGNSHHWNSCVAKCVPNCILIRDEKRRAGTLPRHMD
jgi:hypothetical protein